MSKMSYTPESLKTVIANIDVESKEMVEVIDDLLKESWKQVDERIKSLKDLESLKEEILNKCGEINE